MRLQIIHVINLCDYVSYNVYDIFKNALFSVSWPQFIIFFFL